MSRKRGKKKKAVVEAIPDDLLAEGSGPVGGPSAEQIATVEDIATTADVVTTDDIVTADDVVRTAPEPDVADEDPASTPESAAPAADDRAAVEHAPSDDDELDASAATPEPLDESEDADASESVARAAAEESEDGAAASEDGAEGTDPGEPGEAGEPGDPEDGGGEEDGPVFPTSAASMDAVQLKYLVEALIFASDRPLTLQRLRQLSRVSDVRRLQQALVELEADHRDRGVVLQQVSGGYQFRTRTQFSAWVQQLIAGRPVRLSRAQLETLAIIAYRQPITRPEIDDIRGVDSSNTLKLLLDRMLIRVLGKREEVGRPTLYGTTKEFLDFFSLGDLRELPTLREYSELTAESRKVMSDRLGIPVDGSEGGEGSGGAEGGAGGQGFAMSADGGVAADDDAPLGAEAAAEDALAAFAAAAAAVDRSEAAELAPDLAEAEDPGTQHEGDEVGEVREAPAVHADGAGEEPVQLEADQPAEAVGRDAGEPDPVERDLEAVEPEAVEPELEAVEPGTDLDATAREPVEPGDPEASSEPEDAATAAIDAAPPAEVLGDAPADDADAAPASVARDADVIEADILAQAVEADGEASEAIDVQAVDVEVVDLDAPEAERGEQAASVELAALEADAGVDASLETVVVDALVDAGAGAEGAEAQDGAVGAEPDDADEGAEADAGAEGAAADVEPLEPTSIEIEPSSAVFIEVADSERSDVELSAARGAGDASEDAGSRVAASDGPVDGPDGAPASDGIVQDIAAAADTAVIMGSAAEDAGELGEHRDAELAAEPEAPGERAVVAEDTSSASGEVSSDRRAQVGGTEESLGAPGFSVIASIDDRPVERAVMDSNAIGTAALDDNRDDAAAAVSPNVDPAAE